MTLFDSHAHLDDPRFDADREEIICDMTSRDMLCVCVGADMQTSRAAVKLAERNVNLWAATAVHPHEAKSYKREDAETLREWAAMKKIVAIGEIGLDFHYDLSPRKTQTEVFIEQLELAYTLDIPAILHVREAHGEAINILRGRKDSLPPFVLHCYSGSAESVKTYLDMGAMISFSGSVTFKNAVKLRETATAVPPDRLMIETDSPYLSPEPVRGRRNDPRNVVYIADFLAALRDVTAEELAKTTEQNALRFYKIDR